MRQMVWGGRTSWLLVLAGACVAGYVPSASSQVLRDPTAEPAYLGSGVGGDVQPGPDVAALPVLVVDGRPHVIMGTRLYAPGQKLGAARIERITDTEVWLREGSVLRKVSRYPGVERRSVAPVGASGCTERAKSSSAAKSLPREGPCASAQP
jgi:hypothetical protein